MLSLTITIFLALNGLIVFNSLQLWFRPTKTLEAFNIDAAPDNPLIEIARALGALAAIFGAFILYAAFVPSLHLVALIMLAAEKLVGGYMLLRAGAMPVAMFDLAMSVASVGLLIALLA